MSAAKPAVKFRYLKGGFDIVGDHKQAYEARKVFDYWLAKDRQDKIVRPERGDTMATVDTIASDVVRQQ